MGRGRKSGAGNKGRKAAASASASHPYLAAVQANFERTIPLDYHMNDFVDGTYQKLTHSQIVEKATRMIEENLSSEVLSMFQSQNVKIVIDHDTVKSRLDPRADGHWDASTGELVLRDIVSPSTLRHEAGHALSSNLRARQQHFEYESRGYLLHDDTAFLKAVETDLNRIKTSGTIAEKTFAFTHQKYYTDEINSINGPGYNNRKFEMFAETYSHLTVPSSSKWHVEYAQKWENHFPETTKAVKQIIKNITETPLNSDGSPRRFGTEKAKPTY